MTSADGTLPDAPAPPDGAQPAPPNRHAAFHLLRVAELERITDDAIAITFDVPEDLREQYRFMAGQHLASRWTTYDATTRSAPRRRAARCGSV